MLPTQGVELLPLKNRSTQLGSSMSSPTSELVSLLFFSRHWACISQSQPSRETRGGGDVWGASKNEDDYGWRLIRSFWLVEEELTWVVWCSLMLGRESGLMMMMMMMMVMTDWWITVIQEQLPSNWSSPYPSLFWGSSWSVKPSIHYELATWLKDFGKEPLLCAHHFEANMCFSDTCSWILAFKSEKTLPHPPKQWEGPKIPTQKNWRELFQRSFCLYKL